MNHIESVERPLELAIFGISHLKVRDFLFILSRNLFLLTNGIIFSVVLLLYIFGDHRAAIFLGLISIINVSMGLIQDINAWLALERLQLLTAPRVLRLSDDGTEMSVLLEDTQKGDRIRLRIGDQVPSDSIILAAHGLEVSEGLITGESDSLPRGEGDRLLGGSVVTAGSGTIRTETVFHESRIARMTEGIKKYTVNQSPIQKSVELVVKYAGYVLLGVIVFVVAHGVSIGESQIAIVNEIGAISSVLVPAGLVFATTLLYAYGAAHLFRRQVLLQEVNATEKLGRIRNLCMDKTGTLTENTLTVESLHVPDGGSEALAKEVAAAYIRGAEESSQTIEAVKRFIGREYQGNIEDSLTFSSWRRFGGVRIAGDGTAMTALIGSPDIFLPHVADSAKRRWLEALIGTHAKEGKRILCIVESDEPTLARELSDAPLRIIGVFTFFNNLREGIRDTVDFFQNRGVHIRIISGDNPETVRAVAVAAGVRGTDRVITGAEMESWSDDEFGRKVKEYAIFARILPEQKERIIHAFKQNGFTAMIGDGANDALAIKKADLGIAMFDGAPATRQFASVVLMNNSFAALPGGVELADSVIRSIEIFASIFFNVSLTGFFFFIIVSALGQPFPFTPLNMALINYVAIGFPGILVSVWVILPVRKVRQASATPFLSRILPFSVTSSTVHAIVLSAVFSVGRLSGAGMDAVMLTLIMFILSGFVFFVFILRVYLGTLPPLQLVQMAALGLIEIVLLALVFNSQWLSTFFNLTPIATSGTAVAATGWLLLADAVAQYGIMRWFVWHRKMDGGAV